MGEEGKRPAEKRDRPKGDSEVGVNMVELSSLYDLPHYVQANRNLREECASVHCVRSVAQQLRLLEFVPRKCV